MTRMSTHQQSHSVPPGASTPGTLATRTVDFDGHPVTAVKYRDRWCWRGAEVGTAIGYEHGRTLVDNIRDAWAGDFVEGTDYLMLTGSDFAEFNATLNDSSDRGSQTRGRGGARAALVLTETGIDLALVLAQTDKGRRLRRFLAEYVLPQLRQTGRVDLRGANDSAIAEQMDALRQSVTQQGQMIEMMRQILSRLDSGPTGGVIGEGLAREAIEIPIESAIETHAHSKKARRSLRRSLYNRLQSAAQFTGKDCEWKNLPVSQLARAQRALSGMLKEVPDRAAKLDAKYGALGPLFDKRKKHRARKVTPKTST